MVWSDGRRYFGEFKAGKRNGEGTIIDGHKTYSGQWKNGLEDGEGTITINGVSTRGVWRNGKLVSRL